MNKFIKSIIFLFFISFFSIKSVNAAQCTDPVSNAIKAPASYDVTTSIKKNGGNSTFNYTFKVTSSVKSVRDEIKNIDYTYECYDATFSKNKNFEYVVGTQYTSGSFKFDNTFKKNISFNAPNSGNYVCIFKINSYTTSGGCLVDLKVDEVIETNKPSKATLEKCMYPTTIDTISDAVTSPIDCGVTQTGDFEKAFCTAKTNAMKNAKTDKTNGNKLYSTISDSFSGTLNFKCDPKKGIEGMINGTINPNNYVNISYAYGSSTETIPAGTYKYHYTPDVTTNGKTIKVTNRCEEAVTIEYGAPVASKAGLCFQYKVKVTSRVVCSVDKIPEPPEVSHDYCEPSPVCVHRDEDGHSVELDQGGPNEDFDSCIKNCDGGKYTSKCSSKCYKEVYGGSSTKMSSSLDLYNISATKLANNNECLPEKGESCKPCKLDFAKAYYKKYPVYEGTTPGVCTNVSKPDIVNQCYFKYNSSNELIWYCPDTVEDNNRIYGRWYAYSENSDWGIVEQCQYSVYKDTDNGIPRRDHSDGGRCHDECYWEVDYSSCGGTKYLNPGWAEYDNKNNMKIYNDAVSSAAASAKCTTSQATFTISSTYYDSEEKKNVTINFPYDNQKDFLKSGTDTSNSASKGNTTLISYDGCYKNINQKNWYQAEWSFPGSYLDTKHNGLSYDYNNTTKNWEKVKAFCLPLVAGNVNTEWYNWFMTKVIAGKETSVTSNEYREECLSKGDSKAITKVTNFTDTNSLVWNIVAKTRNFGYYKWNINISCFYAINSNSSTGRIDKSPSDNSEECVTNSDGYSIRSVDLKNLFPDANGSNLTDTSSSGRTPGFNWSEYATNTINNSSYSSNPSEYMATVQSLGYSVYDERYLDYYFELDKADLNSLKNHDYTSFGGESVKRNNGIYSYYSNDVHQYASKAPGKATATTCNNLKNYRASSCEN